jgi:hypothetical protein
MAEGKDSHANSLMVCPTSRQNALVLLGESSMPQHCALHNTTLNRIASGASDTIALIVFPAHAFLVSQSNLPQRKGAKMKAACMNQLELAVRWKISHRTLERWRWTGEGPRFVKLGGRVVYRLEDVEAYEQAMIRTCTPANERALETGD